MFTIPFRNKMYWEKLPQDTATFESLFTSAFFFAISLHFQWPIASDYWSFLNSIGVICLFALHLWSTHPEQTNAQSSLFAFNLFGFCSIFAFRYTAIMWMTFDFLLPLLSSSRHVIHFEPIAPHCSTNKVFQALLRNPFSNKVRLFFEKTNKK